MRASCESYAVGANILLRTFLISSFFGRCLVESFDRVWGKDYVLGVSFPFAYFPHSSICALAPHFAR